MRPVNADIWRSSTRSQLSLLAQSGRCEEAESALGQCERLAKAIPADDLLAGVAHNQANVALMSRSISTGRWRLPNEAWPSTRRSDRVTVSPSRWPRSVRFSCSLAISTGRRAILTRTLEVRSPVQFQETTGAVYDSLAQIHMMRGSYERAGEYLRLASDGYGALAQAPIRAAGTSGRCSCSV